jgi:acetate kinase
MGIRIDDARNRSAADLISDATSRCVVRVLVSQEDDQIAQHTWELMPETPR